MTEFPVTYQARWVGDDFSGIPAVSAVAMRRDDLAARREAEQMAADAEEQRENVAHRCRVEGRDTSWEGVMQRAARGFARTDYRDSVESVAASVAAGEAVYLDSPPVGASRSRELSDDDLRDMALRAQRRRIDRDAAAGREATDAAVAEARAAHPATRAWPAWGRRP
ncbi:MAG: hypothetical protein ACLP52_11240 [Streptosporangiaceae bacterium]